MWKRKELLQQFVLIKPLVVFLWSPSSFKSLHRQSHVFGHIFVGTCIETHCRLTVWKHNAHFIFEILPLLQQYDQSLRLLSDRSIRNVCQMWFFEQMCKLCLKKIPYLISQLFTVFEIAVSIDKGYNWKSLKGLEVEEKLRKENSLLSLFLGQAFVPWSKSDIMLYQIMNSNFSWWKFVGFSFNPSS